MAHSFYQGVLELSILHPDVLAVAAPKGVSDVTLDLSGSQKRPPAGASLPGQGRRSAVPNLEPTRDGGLSPLDLEANSEVAERMTT